MFHVYLTDGQTITIGADEFEFGEEYVSFIDKNRCTAAIRKDRVCMILPVEKESV